MQLRGHLIIPFPIPIGLQHCSVERERDGLLQGLVDGHCEPKPKSPMPPRARFLAMNKRIRWLIAFAAHYYFYSSI